MMIDIILAIDKTERLQDLEELARKGTAGDIEDKYNAAKDLVSKGLVMHIVSSGPLGTGFRSKDNFAFVATVVNISLPKYQRNLTSEQVFSRYALARYNEQMREEEYIKQRSSGAILEKLKHTEPRSPKAPEPSEEMKSISEAKSGLRKTPHHAKSKTSKPSELPQEWQRIVSSVRAKVV